LKHLIPAETVWQRDRRQFKLLPKKWKRDLEFKGTQLMKFTMPHYIAS